MVYDDFLIIGVIFESMIEYVRGVNRYYYRTDMSVIVKKFESSWIDYSI